MRKFGELWEHKEVTSNLAGWEEKGKSQRKLPRAGNIC